MARPMPVLPLVGSTTVAPGLSTPRRSASSIIPTAVRSLTLPPGLSDSIFPSTTAPPAFGRRLSRTSGVPPTTSSTDAATFGLPTAAAFRWVMAPNPIGNAGSPRKKGSDAIHRLGGRPTLRRVSLEILERRAIHDGVAGIGHRAPQEREISPNLSARRSSLRTDARAALDGTEHGADCNLLGRLGETIAPRGAASRVEEAGTLEAEQDLLEVPLGNPLSLRDVLDGLQCFAVVGQRQVEHRLDGVLALGGHRHVRLRSRMRATSLAKYVITMSAPARRMPVSASIMAASSSSQPSWPAARSMAYSPDTEYAATGRPNSLFTREMTSRYGSAGLTMTMSAPSSTS